MEGRGQCETARDFVQQELWDVSQVQFPLFARLIL